MLIEARKSKPGLWTRLTRGGVLVPAPKFFPSQLKPAVVLRKTVGYFKLDKVQTVLEKCGSKMVSNAHTCPFSFIVRYEQLHESKSLL